MRQKRPSKKTMAPSDPATLGAMRELGVRSLYITCSACGYASTVNADDWRDDVLIKSFGPNVKCAKCGHVGGVVRPDWSELARTLRR
jgi:ribosomal protein L37E